MRTATNALSLKRPKTIHDALKMLRDDPTLVPMAGCTDLYVSVNFGTLTGTRFLDLWPLERLRKIQLKDDVLQIQGQPRSFTSSEWSYGAYSAVYFADDRVTPWYSADVTLKAREQ